MTTVAITQPYFFPYAGYFRLFEIADVVAIFDCVQFPRRGWVHRNLLPLASGEPAWLTLPVAKSDRDTLIRDLQFSSDARSKFDVAMRRFPLLVRAAKENSPLLAHVRDFGTGTVADYLCRLLAVTNQLLKLPNNVVRTSSLEIPPDIRGQDRVIAVAKHLGATRYVNAAGGRELYDRDTFAAQGIDLRFLAPAQHSNASILTRLFTEDAGDTRAEIQAQTVLLQ